MKNMLGTIALSGSLALSPLAVGAQDYDTWSLNREVLNAAANYTGVLTAAHGQVRKYITWQWDTSLDEADQRQRTEDILRQISDTQQITSTLVPSLNMDVLAGYDVRFRYCDSTLLSYFASTGFKHDLSAQQIVDAPVLRAQRADTTFYGEPLGIVKVGSSTVGSNLILQTGDRSQAIPRCMGALADDPAAEGTVAEGTVAEGTVAYMTSAAQKFGVARTRKQRETRKLPCAGRQVGSGIKQERFESTDYNAQGDPLYNAQSTIPYDPEDAAFDFSYLDTDTPEGDGHWRTKYTHCRAPATISLRLIEVCPNTPDGTATYEVFRTEIYSAFPEIIWLPSDEDGNFTRDAAGNPTVIKHLILHLSFCAGAPDRLTLEPEISHRPESRVGICPAPHTLGSLSEARTVEIRRWNFAASPDVQGFDALREVETEIEGPWIIDDDRCYRNVNQQTTETKVSSCPSGYTGSVSYRREKTVTGVDWNSPKWADQLSTTVTRWVAAVNACRPKPTSVDCRYVYSERAHDNCLRNQRQSRNSGSGGGRSRGDGGQESVDVDGDGQGDYSSFDSRGWGGTDVQGGCGGCNGPRGSKSGSGSGNNGGGSPSGGGGGGGGGGRSGGGSCGCGADR